MSSETTRTITHAENPDDRHPGQARPGGFWARDTADPGKVRLCGLSSTLTEPPPVSKAWIADAISTLTDLTGEAAEYAAREIAAAMTRQMQARGTFTLHGLGSFTLMEAANDPGPAARCRAEAGATLAFEPDPALLRNL